MVTPAWQHPRKWVPTFSPMKGEGAKPKTFEATLPLDAAFDARMLDDVRHDDGVVVDVEGRVAQTALP
eukprot:COSAG02_NODE_24560_length_684_cov_1.143590_2_plen_68_part_00